MTTPLDAAPIRSAADLADRWRSLLHPLAFAGRSLWLTWIGRDGRRLPVVVPVDDLPRTPDPVLLVRLCDVHAGVLHGQLGGAGHLALALCRPGPAEVTGDDDAWTEALRSVLDGDAWSLHLAAAGRVLPVVDGRW
ncbi:hypothetical protein [Blastococcus xanthinilyticus]|nr:hypothetical protein [Blastococcus xanthinilyticus]